MLLLSVQQVQHLPKAPPLGAVVAGDAEGVTLRVLETVVIQGGGLHKLEHLVVVGTEPLKDVRVVGAGSTLGESAVLFHACSLADAKRPGK